MPTPVAPLVAAFRRRLANLPGPGARASGEASNGEPVLIELLVAGVWVDITADGYVLVRDDNGQIAITSGIRDEGSQTERAQAKLQLKNPDGRFTPRNPTGPYYDTLDWLNAQMRISVPDGLGGKSYLLWGEVSEWAPNWDSTGSDVWVDISDNGILQRLAQAPVPERSVIYNAISDPPLTGLVAYWPCEDAAGSVRLASALATGTPMTWTGSPILAAYEEFLASDSLPTLTGASLSGSVALYDTTSVTQYQVRYLLGVPVAGFANEDCVSRIQVEPAGASNMQYLDVHYNAPPGGLGSFGGTGTLSVLPYDVDQSLLGYSGTESITMDVRGRNLRVSVEVSNNGSALAMTLRVLDVDTGVTDSATIGLVSTQVTTVTRVSMAPATLADTAGATGAAVGHVLMQTTITSLTDLGTAIQPSGEAAGRRIQRLCGEEGIPFQWIGDLDDTAALGPQGKQNLLALVQEAQLADGGLLYETTTELGIGYRTRASLYNQDAALVLNYSGYNLSDIPVPVSDDRYLQNRVTVTVNGVSQTVEERSGPRGIDRVGVYGESSGVTLNLATSDAVTLIDQAGWRVHLGVTEDERFPQVSVNLAHSSITPEMRRAILALRPGDLLQITGMPTWLAPDTVNQLIIGKDQTVTHFEHRITFVCAPASPYTVAVLDDADARLDIDSELLTAVGSGDTALTVVPSAGEDSLWTPDSADWPFDARVGGEVVRVTSVTSWLTDTFTRTVSSSWGTPDVGSAWSAVGGGSASDYAVNGTAGVQTLSTVDVSRRTSVTPPGPDFDLYCDITTSALATGDSLYGAVTARMLDAATMYMARLEFTTSNTVVLVLRRLLADATTDIGTYTLPGVTHVAGTYIRVRFQGVGTALKAKAWPAADSVEPPAWNLSGSDSAISPAYSLGTRSIRITGNTNLATVAIQYDNYRIITPQTLTVTRAINGVVKAQTAGSSIALAYPTPLGL